MGSKADQEVDDETDDETDEQPDTTDMPELESKNSTEQGLKILTPKQMLSRLPVSLAQLQAGNTSQKLKNEISQSLYSLYRSKNSSKTIYRSLINNM